MTLTGAIKQLHELRSAEDMPIYYKPAIAEVINVLLMDTQEVRHGHWEWNDYGGFGNYHCTVCRHIPYGKFPRKYRPDYMYCPHCGAKMDEVAE